MKAVCPTNPDHSKFITVAHVMEEWVVTSDGSWLETLQCIEVTKDPDPHNVWTCKICGEPVTVTHE